MDSWHVIGLLSMALLATAMCLSHQVRLVRALKQLLHRVLILWGKKDVPELNTHNGDHDVDHSGLRER